MVRGESRPPGPGQRGRHLSSFLPSSRVGTSVLLAGREPLVQHLPFYRREQTLQHVWEQISVQNRACVGSRLGCRYRKLSRPACIPQWLLPVFGSHPLSKLSSFASCPNLFCPAE